jgi:hypothetical protein
VERASEVSQRQGDLPALRNVSSRLPIPNMCRRRKPNRKKNRLASAESQQSLGSRQAAIIVGRMGKVDAVTMHAMKPHEALRQNRGCRG